MISTDSLLREKGLTKQDILNIDKYNLDEECMNHPNICEIVGELLFEMEGKRDSLELDKDEVFAQKAIDFKKEAAINDEKTSDAKIAQMVIINPLYKSLQRQYLDLKLQCKLLKNIKEGLDIKTAKINDLVHLHNSGYFVRNLGMNKEGVAQLKLQEKRRLIQSASI